MTGGHPDKEEISPDHFGADFFVDLGLISIWGKERPADCSWQLCPDKVTKAERDLPVQLHFCSPGSFFHRSSEMHKRAVLFSGIQNGRGLKSSRLQALQPLQNCNEN